MNPYLALFALTTPPSDLLTINLQQFYPNP